MATSCGFIVTIPLCVIRLALICNLTRHKGSWLPFRLTPVTLGHYLEKMLLLSNNQIRYASRTYGGREMQKTLHW